MKKAKKKTVREKPLVGPFYIFLGQLHAALGDDYGHVDFWPDIVQKLFTGKLDPITLDELSLAYCGTDRGRVVVVDGKVIVHGTSGCAEYLDLIKKTYNLSGKIMNMIGGDGHYRVMGRDRKTLENILNLHVGKLP